jgi:DNA-binding MarR family transcriptional regulator
MKELDSRIYEGLASFRLALRRFLAFSERATVSEGATPQQYQALLALKAHVGGPMTVGALAEEMLLQPHGAVQMIDRLAACGWVERLHSLSDGRSVHVALTPEGAKVLRRLAAAHMAELLVQEPLLAESLRRLRKIAPS